MFEVLTSLLLRLTPFTIFSGPIRFCIRKRWKVLKSVEKGGFGHNHENYQILVRKKYEKNESRASFEPMQSAS